MTTLLLVALGAFLLGYALGRRRPARTVVYDARPLPSAADDPEVVALVQRGAKIDAIRRYRQLHGTGLRESREAVEALERPLRGR